MSRERDSIVRRTQQSRGRQASQPSVLWNGAQVRGSGNYFGWSPIESSYGLTHSVTISNLPAAQTIYLTVLSKDQAGNQGVSAEQTLNLHQPTSGWFTIVTPESNQSFGRRSPEPSWFNDAPFIVYPGNDPRA